MRSSRVTAALLLILCSATASAFDPARWIYVRGGTWLPSPSELRRVEDALKPAVVSATQKTAFGVHAWSDYTFQFQGRTNPRGQKFVFVNAYCDQAGVKDTSQWITVLDGGSCFFCAKYDPDNRRIYDLVVNPG